MHCPQCGQQQVSGQTRFCSRCGFLMTGVADLIASNGFGATSTSKPPFMASGSPRRRGVLQGAFIVLLSFLIVPIVAAISIALNGGPFATFVTAVLLGIGGLLRVVYALMFESGTTGGKTIEENLFAASQQILAGKTNSAELPPASAIPVGLYTAPEKGSWRDTNDLAAAAGSVTDSTTKLLERDSN